jgi:hypothetical protein
LDGARPPPARNDTPDREEAKTLASCMLMASDYPIMYGASEGPGPLSLSQYTNGLKEITPPATLTVKKEK